MRRFQKNDMVVVHHPTRGRVCGIVSEPLPEVGREERQGYRVVVLEETEENRYEKLEWEGIVPSRIVSWIGQHGSDY